MEGSHGGLVQKVAKINSTRYLASMTLKELTIAGVLLYACEGTKLRKDPRHKNTYIYAIELTNSDPKIIYLFVKFLLTVIEIDKKRLRGQLFVYQDHNIAELKKYWSKKTGIPLGQFHKVIELKNRNSKYKPNPLGTFKVRYSCKEDFLKLQEIISSVWKGAGVV